MIVRYAVCKCPHVWPLAVGYNAGRCGRCGEETEPVSGATREEALKAWGGKEAW